jgi:hypothetical protein
MYLDSRPSTHTISGLAASRASEEFEVNLKLIME